MLDIGKQESLLFICSLDESAPAIHKASTYYCRFSSQPSEQKRFDMQEVEARTPRAFASKTIPSSRIAAFFDGLEYCVERLEGLIWKSKRLIFGTAFMLFLIYELAHFAKFLVQNWTG